MRNKIYTIPIICYLLFSIIGCKDNSNPIGSNGAQELLPLKVGNKWTFETTFYPNIGAPPQISSVSIEVLRDTLIGNDTWYITNHFGIYRNTVDGVWKLEGSPKLIYPYPSKVNDSVKTDNISFTKVVSLKDSITVPYGLFSCMHYNVFMIHGSGFILNDYLALGVGFVSFESANYDGTANAWYLSARYQLKDYQLK